MASAPADPSEILRSSTEKNNYTRLTRLLIEGGTFILRELLDKIIPPHQFKHVLMLPKVHSKLKLLKKKKVITPLQWKSLFPTVTSWGKSTDFDITLIFKLLRNFCSLTPPPKGWDELPDDKDLTLPADLARIKYYRNDVYAHNDKMELDDSEFQNLWKRIKDALMRIVQHYNRPNPSAVLKWETAIEKLLTDPLDIKKSHEDNDKLKIWCIDDPQTLSDLKDENARLKDQVTRLESSLVNVHCNWRSRMQWMIAGSVSTLLILNYKDDPESLINMISDALPVGLVVKSIVAGSIVLQLTSTSDEALNDLLTRYQSGQLREDLAKIFMTEEIKALFDGQDVEFSVEICEEEIENARRVLISAAEAEKKREELTKKEGLAQALKKTKLTTDLNIFDGEIVEDGENRVQAHLAVITSKDQVEEVFAELKKKDPGVDEATHNIWAYRIFDAERNVYHEHCDDDGDDTSGARVLRFLRRTNAMNVIVVVSCWYETTADELGEVRFKYIQKSVLDLLLTSGIEIRTSKIKKYFEEIKYTPFEKMKEQEIPKFEILHGETIEDRKSTFQAHLADITSREQVDQVLDELKKDRKIAKATYNMWACRIYDEKKKSYIEEGYDDGENLGGERLLHLLQRSDAKNVVIIVTRWHGGIHLGNDRFKHINKCASDLLQRRKTAESRTSTASTDPKSTATKKKKSKKHK
ncbi:uncharacterized protein LOC116292323 isoform X1 [Actinia tenebrosa]|uniref:Uncharacterized protein LOC116292323 isoform X1 n=1 Tax=Actinia tenebrosa TaxID=6105 RepID=A0A6P8HGD5_ACTTE|nr:uncharacterized protein LOC116292323 isoform X1 [Actinia tenebrosa]